ncbi:hypothetical protein WN72_43605 [Bradyrhizobium arachidis]|uniref:Uncharacterized protein n=1 Tax=Bradyrhizobium arachidis TaxID=858423 RepID=A0AAE7NZM5_9BRAD|nr:hypothetical protein WN72_43605 [Bradyrhizobium arachidis]
MDSGLALRAPRNDKETYFFSIGGATFSAGAGGNTGFAAPCVCGSGRAGSGAGVVGRSPPGLDSAGVLLCSSDGVPWSGCVACAVCIRLSARICASDTTDTTTPAANSEQAIVRSSFSLRLSFWPGISITAFVRGINETGARRFRGRMSGNLSPARQSAALTPSC